jgi:hypothetical protein
MLWLHRCLRPACDIVVCDTVTLAAAGKLVVATAAHLYDHFITSRQHTGDMVGVAVAVTIGARLQRPGYTGSLIATFPEKRLSCHGRQILSWLQLERPREPKQKQLERASKQMRLNGSISLFFHFCSISGCISLGTWNWAPFLLRHARNIKTCLKNV